MLIISWKVTQLIENKCRCLSVLWRVINELHCISQSTNRYLLGSNFTLRQSRKIQTRYPLTPREQEKRFRAEVLLLLFSRSAVSDSLWAHGLCIAHQAPLSLGFPTQEYWTGLPSPPPGDLPNPGIKCAPPALAAGSFTTQPPGKPEGMCKELEKHYSRGCLWELFPEEIIIRISKTDDHLSPLQVATAQSVEHLDRTERWRKDRLAPLMPRHSSSPALKHQSPDSSGFGLRLDSNAGFPSSPSCRQQIMRQPL